MRKFKISVNGISYQVEVEEINGSPGPAAIPVMKNNGAPGLEAKTPGAVVSSAPVAPPTSAPAAPVAGSPAVSIGEGDSAVKTPMPGKVTKIFVTEGQQVNKGEVVIILEAMKMQNEIPATAAGTIKSINVTIGQGLKAGDIIAVIG